MRIRRTNHLLFRRPDHLLCTFTSHDGKTIRSIHITPIKCMKHRFDAGTLDRRLEKNCHRTGELHIPDDGDQTRSGCCPGGIHVTSDVTGGNQGVTSAGSSVNGEMTKLPSAYRDWNSPRMTTRKILQLPRTRKKRGKTER